MPGPLQPELMGSHARTSGNKGDIKKRVVEQFIDRRIVRPWRSVPPARVKGWFPKHEQGMAVTVLMELLSEETPVTYAVPGKTIWLKDIVKAQKHLDRLRHQYPHWFE